MRVEILGTKIDKVTMDEALEKISSFIAEGTPRQVVTLNAEIIYRAQSEEKLKFLINNADLVTPDGAGVVWAARKLGTPLPERVTGIDLLQEIVEKASIYNWKLYFFGAAPTVAETAAKKLQQKYQNLNKNLKIVGTSHGFISSNEMPALLAEINEVKPDVLFVALGAPRQEYWIQKYMAQLKVPVCIGVGGSLDVIAGKVKRAPKIFQKLKLEWLYRLIKEPWRYKRMLALPKFMLKILQETKRKQRTT
ncbi:WecB/TagA/CpsF family glycosyltransferase [Bacillota bacterium LX-D]|nr:WecB/TagA/CpsF family glycosyltransferase [Bacillota bacterium LX-D]